MASAGNIMLLLVIFNAFLFMYVPDEYLLLRDGNVNVLDQFFDVDTTTNTTQGIDQDFEATIPKELEKSEGGVIAGIVNFIGSVVDIIPMVWNFFRYVINFMAMPLSMFIMLDMPSAFQFLVGVPLVFLYIFGLIDWLRGGSSLK